PGDWNAAHADATWSRPVSGTFASVAPEGSSWHRAAPLAQEELSGIEQLADGERSTAEPQTAEATLPVGAEVAVKQLATLPFSIEQLLAAAPT
ncbi:hypothetical protein, partial [Sphingomonas sp. 10B4]